MGILKPGLFLPLLALAACGPRTIDVGPTVPTTVRIGTGHRAFVSWTDMDRVYAVAAGAERVFVATDKGLLVYAAGSTEAPIRIRQGDGLAADEVTAVAVLPDGSAVAGSQAGLARIEGSSVSSLGDPDLGRLNDLHVAEDGALWACGERGVARALDGAFSRIGEPANCLALEPTPEGALWVATTRGAWFIDGDIIREHGVDVIPETYVHSIVPLPEGKALALLRGPGATVIGYFNGTRWHAYTIGEFEPVPLALVAFGDQAVVVTRDHAFVVSRDLPGVSMTPLSRSAARRVRSYRARISLAGEAGETTRQDQITRGPSAFARIPSQLATVEAPSLTMHLAATPSPVGAYLAAATPGGVFLAEANRGVRHVTADGSVSHYTARDLAHARDLQIAVDTTMHTWVLGRDGDLGRLEHGILRRVPAPEGTTLQSIASGPQGVYAMTMVDGSASTVRAYRVDADGWTPLLERHLTLQTPLRAVPFFAVAEDEQLWVALRVTHEQSDGTRMRGVAVLNPRAPAVTYHHRGASTDQDGPGALSMPDEIDTIDLGQANHAWFASLSGAVRVGGGQAVVFGEARGVRGEVVSDVTVGEHDRVWIAAAEGVGYFERATVNFRLPALVQQARPTALAVSREGHLWGVGRRGAIYHDGTTWQPLTEQDGLPAGALRDVEIDGRGRVWMLAEHQVIVFTAQ